MALKDDYEFELLVNEAKNLVIDELEKQLEQEEYNNICKCQECILDMATYALNKIKPKYRSSFTGLVYAQELHLGEYKDEVATTVKNAIQKISKNPSHDVNS